MGWINNAAAVVWHALPQNRQRNAAGQPSDWDDRWYETLGTGTPAGIRITPDIALKASSIYACIKILAETLASVPLRMRKDVGSGAVDAPDHPLDELIRFQPNRRNTAVEFWETMLLHAALRGVGYAEIKPGPRGAVDQLVPIHSDRVTKTDVLPDGSLRFEVQDPKTLARRVLLQEEVFRIPGLSSDGITPIRVVDTLADDLGVGMAADQYAGRVFSNKLNIGGFLTHPGRLSPEAQKRLIERLVSMYAGAANMHRPMVLQEGVKFEKASMDAKDAQLLEARKWQITVIAQRFRIPLQMLGIYDGATHSNVEQQALEFVKYTLRPWCRRIEQAIRRDLIVAKGLYFAEFNLEGLLRGDAAARAGYFAQALGSGGHRPWLTVNEVRRIEGYPDDKNGDTLENPTNMQQQPAQSAEPPAATTQSSVPRIAPPTLALPDDSAAARAERLARKENKALRRGAMRFADDPDARRDWIRSFYGGFQSSVTDILGVEKSVAKTYCEYQRDKALLANDLEGLIEWREEHLAAEIAAVLERAEQD